jgi:hypothetical protein
VSSVAQCVLRHSPTEALWVDVMDQLVTLFWKQEEQHSRIEKSNMRVSDLIHGLPSSWVQLSNRLEEAVGWLWMEQAA